jgi:hypothetical protein
MVAVFAGRVEQERGMAIELRDEEQWKRQAG